jgi:hypothetical protein
MSTWVALISGAVGAVLAFGGTVFGQVLTGRTAEKRDRLAVAVATRTEKRATIEEFIDLYQKIEDVAARDVHRDPGLIAQMWVTHNRLALIGSDQLQEPLGEIAGKLNHVFWHGPGDQPAYAFLHTPWREFREAARRELDVNIA